MKWIYSLALLPWALPCLAQPSLMQISQQLQQLQANQQALQQTNLELQQSNLELQTSNQALQQQVESLRQQLADAPKNRGYDVVVETGVSNKACADVHLPAGTSLATHDIYISGGYSNYSSHGAGFVSQINRRLDTEVTHFCAPYYDEYAYFRLSYTLTAYPK